MEQVGAIVVAAGMGTRAGGPKQLRTVGGRPLVAWSVEALTSCGDVTAGVLVVVPGTAHEVKESIRTWDSKALFRAVDGGERRQDSVRSGLKALPETEWVIVHDAARIFLRSEMISAGLAAARETGAATIGRRLTDTLKRVNRSSLVAETVERDGLWTVQTPQVFRREVLERAHEAGAVQDVTDDAALVELAGGKVKIYEGPSDNIKLTTTEDFELAEAMLAARRNEGARVPH